MLSLLEYLKKQQRIKKIDEFDVSNLSENMAKSIAIVSDYYTNYLSLDKIEVENITREKNWKRNEKNLRDKYETTYDFIKKYYIETGIRLDRKAESILKQSTQSYLYFEVSDFIDTSDELLKDIDDSYLNNNKLIIQTILLETEKGGRIEPNYLELYDMPNDITDWIMNTYQKFGVNLSEYAYDVMRNWFDKFVKTEYDRESEQIYYINSYDYRYKENPFNLDKYYEPNKERPFISGKRNELEMLFMFEWLTELDDMDYWPEYQALMIKSGRIKLKKSHRNMRTVNIRDLNYPEEFNPKVSFIKISGHKMPTEVIEKPYILYFDTTKEDDKIWTEKDIHDIWIENLINFFKKNGAPEILEFSSPYKTAQMNVKFFLEKYSNLERKMRRFTKMKIAIRNIPNVYRKRNAILRTSQEIAEFKNIVKEMGLKLKIALDATNYKKKSPLLDPVSAFLSNLMGIRSSIVALHVDKLNDWQTYRSSYNGDGTAVTVDRFRHDRLGEVMSSYASLFNDSRLRYFIPDNVSNSEELEKTVDLFYRAGVIFDDETN